MIGLSVSMCTQDIVRLSIPMHFVERIIARTRIENLDELNQVIAEYRQIHWRYVHAKNGDDLDRFEKTMRELFASGKVTQPRLLDDDECCPIVPYRDTRYIPWTLGVHRTSWIKKPPQSLLDTPLKDWPVTIIT